MAHTPKPTMRTRVVTLSKKIGWKWTTALSLMLAVAFYTGVTALNEWSERHLNEVARAPSTAGPQGRTAQKCKYVPYDPSEKNPIVYEGDYCVRVPRGGHFWVEPRAFTEILIVEGYELKIYPFLPTKVRQSDNSWWAPLGEYTFLNKGGTEPTQSLPDGAGKLKIKPVHAEGQDFFVVRVLIGQEHLGRYTSRRS